MMRKIFGAVLCVGISLGAYADTQEKSLDVAVQKSTKNNDQRAGGAGGLEFGVITLDMDPLKKAVKRSLNVGGFNFEDNRFFTVGGVGYAGQRRNGVRIGCAGLVAYNSFLSDEWASVADSAYQLKTGESTIDSVVQLHVAVAHLGLLIEKSWKTFQNLNIFAGTLIGGGAMLAIEEPREAHDAFRDADYYDDDDSLAIEKDIEDTRVAWAPLWAFDIHGGATYSLTRWLHVGMYASMIVYYSSSGFGVRDGSFMTVNPGVKVRIVFGTSA